jgi:hypothetical protein
MNMNVNEYFLKNGYSEMHNNTYTRLRLSVDRTVHKSLGVRGDLFRQMYISTSMSTYFCASHIIEELNGE